MSTNRSIAERIIDRVTRRPPDFIIGGVERPYLRRWWITPWSGLYRDVEPPNWWQNIIRRLPGIYLHQFLRSDDDRALHDHPWANLSILLRGSYIEHTIEAGGIERRTVLTAGQWRFRWTGRLAHRVELLTVSGFVRPQPTPVSCWSLFITGPRYRSWGFHCPAQGWIPWRRFTAESDPGSIGKGCDA